MAPDTSTPTDVPDIVDEVAEMARLRPRRRCELTAEERIAVGATSKNLRRVLKAIKADVGRGKFRKLTRRKNREELTVEVASRLYEAQPEVFAATAASYEAEMAIFDGNRNWDGTFLRAVLEFIKEFLPILLRLIALF